MPQTIALIGGTGRLGPGLALRLCRGGLPILIGSRDLQHALDVAERVTALGGAASIRGATNADAAAAGDLAILTVPYEAQEGLLPALATPLAGKVVVAAAPLYGLLRIIEKQFPAQVRGDELAQACARLG